MVFDDKKKKKKETEEFEKIVREMEKIIEDAFKSAFNMQPFIKGFSLRINEDGLPEIEEFGIEKEEEADIIEDNDKIYVTIELPNANEKDIKMEIDGNILKISYKSGVKEIKLPSKINPKEIKKTYKNGILDIEFKKI